MIWSVLLNRNTLTITAIGIAIAVFLLMSHTIQVERGRADSFQSLHEAAQREVEIYRASDGTSRAISHQAEVNQEALKIMIKQQDSTLIALRKDFNNLKKSMKNLEGYTRTATITTTEIRTEVRDTVFVDKNGDDVIAQAISYKDSAGFVSFDAVIRDDKFIGEIHTTDSLDVVTYWTRKNFLSKKEYKTEIRSANPNSTLIYNESLRVKRKRRKKRGFFGLFRK